MKIIKVSDETHALLMHEKINGKHKTIDEAIKSKLLPDEFAEVAEQVPQRFRANSGQPQVIDAFGDVTFIPDSQEQQ